MAFVRAAASSMQGTTAAREPKFLAGPTLPPHLDPSATVTTARVQLNSGAAMPVVGYGTYRADGPPLKAGVLEALRAGYRHIDVHDRDIQLLSRAIATPSETRSSNPVTTDRLHLRK